VAVKDIHERILGPIAGYGIIFSTNIKTME